MSFPAFLEAGEKTRASTGKANTNPDFVLPMNPFKNQYLAPFVQVKATNFLTLVNPSTHQSCVHGRRLAKSIRSQ